MLLNFTVRVWLRLIVSDPREETTMSSVTTQMLNSNGAPELRRDLASIRNQLAASRKEVEFLLKALESKAPEVMEAFKALKQEDEAAAAQTRAAAAMASRQLPLPSAIGSLRR